MITDNDERLWPGLKALEKKHLEREALARAHDHWAAPIFVLLGFVLAFGFLALLAALPAIVLHLVLMAAGVSWPFLASYGVCVLAFVFVRVMR